MMKKNIYLLFLIILSISLVLPFKIKSYKDSYINRDFKNNSQNQKFALSRANQNSNVSTPKESLIRLVSDTIYYRVIYNTPILDKPNGNKIRILKEDEVITQVSLDGEYGNFITLNDNIEGYVHLGDLKAEDESSTFYGIATVDKVIKNDDSVYVLAKGEPVVIKESSENKFVIVNDDKSEFVINNSDIKIARAYGSANRSLVSRKTKNLSKVVAAAYDLLGKPYIYGDIGKRGYDCSGLVYSIYLNQLGIELPRNSSAQARFGTKVKKSELVPGDLLFFGSGNRISHVGIYIGDGNMIHSSTGKMKVKIDSIESGYYKNRLITATRIIN